jgi:PAS domain S-box-containing protein
MKTLNSYTDLHLLAESSHSTVFRARSVDNESVILKLLSQEYPSPASLATYRLEYEITKKLSNIPGVIQVKGIEKYQNTLVIIFEDFGGESLRSWQQQRPFTLEEVLTIGIKIANTLEEIHNCHVIHKDINPSNIVWHPSTNTLKLIDFGIATQLSAERPTFNNANILEGTLSYISPEQTGRMNRNLDYRTDFYSLGVTLFELLTNQLPFYAQDALELIHCHLAKEPPSLLSVDPSLPPVLDKIISKLMAKNAEDRYQSGSALAYDLQQCLAGKTEFAIATIDRVSQFQIPPKLYGRERQIEQLLSSFYHARSGSLEIVTVVGLSGIGKSSLVQELYKTITQERGFFIQGKFDQYQRDIPYSGLISAFQGLLRQLLGLNTAQLDHWRREIALALGDNGQVLSAVMPELRTILGEQPPVPVLSPLESLRRFQFVFLNFLGVFASPDHPLVLFLDDMQWSDSGTLDLIKYIITTFTKGNLLLILAYRSEAKESSPFLEACLNELNKKIPIKQILLDNLSLEDLQNMLAETLKHPPDRLSKLAKLVLKKTSGNPFFINTFLYSLYEQNLLVFKEGKWVWELDKIAQCSITGNVLELVEQKIQQLSPDVQQLLQIAACIGNEFKLDCLIYASQRPIDLVISLLKQGIDGGVILPLSTFHRYLDATGDQELSTGQSITYRFIHDRLQQACYALIADEQKQQIHYQIGQQLLSNLEESDLDRQLFCIVNQFNLALSQITSPEEKEELALLNLRAGQKAKATVAFGSALQYLEIALSLLPPNCWQVNYGTTLQIYLEVAEACYLNAKFDRMEELLQVILTHSRSVIDRARAYEIKIQAQISENKILEAVRTGLAILAELGFHFPERPSILRLLLRILRLRLLIWGRNVRSFIHLPVMTDPMKLASLRVLTLLGSPAYFCTPKLFPLLAIEAASLSIRFGNAPMSSPGYVACGVIFVNLQNFELATAFADLSLAILEKFQTTAYAPKTLVAVTSFTSHWRYPIRQTFAALINAHRYALETGDLEYAALSLHVHSYRAFLAGFPLPELDRDFQSHLKTMAEIHQHRLFLCTQLFYQLLIDLSYEQPVQLYKDEEVIKELQTNNDRHALFNYYFCRLIYSVLMGEYTDARRFLLLAEEYQDGAAATLSIPFLNFYGSLTRCGLVSTMGGRERHRLLKQIHRNQQQMAKWAATAPMNFLPKYLIIAAKVDYLRGNYTEAMTKFDQAIRTAKNQEETVDLAIAYEQAAYFYFHTDRTLIGNTYLHQAHYTYSQWGATTKVKLLEQQFPHILKSNSSKIESVTSTSHTSSRGNSLDFATVAKAAQAISQKLVLTELMQELIRITVENAGAQTGVLLLPERQELLLMEWYSTQPDRFFPKSCPLHQLRRQLPTSVINYVARTHTPLLAPLSEVNDPCLPLSLMCVPILQQNELIGVIYLENNLMPDAFSQERLMVVQVLAAQAAISLQNALLYQKLEQKVEERTIALKESEAKYRNLVQTANSIILRWDLNGRIKFLNEYGLKFFGYAEEEIIGQSFIGTLLADRPENHALIQDIIANPDRYTLNENENICRDGTCVWISWSNRVIAEPNQPIEILSVGHDATQRRQAELKLQAAQQQIIAQEKLASLGALTAGIAHEIRNPLNFVNNFAQLSMELLEEITAYLPPDNEAHQLLPDLYHNLQEIHRQGNRANNIIQTMLLHARHEGGNFQPTDLNALLDQALKLAYHGRRAKHPDFKPTIETHYDPTIGEIMAVPQDLSRAFINIIDNALYALEKHSQTQPADYCPTLSLTTTNLGEQVEITIEDNGMGIPPEIQSKIFMPFFTSKPTGEGTGLGLSLTHDIVVGQHKGQIAVVSEVGCFTQFRLTLERNL